MKKIWIAVATVAVLAASAAAVAATSGVANGGFESGSLAPWTPINEGFTEWQTSDGTGLSTTCAIVLPGPRTGTFDAIENQAGGSGWGVLYQDVVVPADATTLSFALTWANGHGSWSMPSGHELDDGQFLSVDVLKAGASPESFASSDIIATPVRMSSGSANLVSPWQTYVAQLGSHAGSTVRLRFAVAGETGCMPVGVDDVTFVQNAVVQDERAAYCSVAGDTWPDGTPIAPGTFLNLEAGQPSTGDGYAHAVPANYVAGVGLTCDPPPAGDTQQGTAGAAQHVAGGIYPYYAPAS